MGCDGAVDDVLTNKCLEKYYMYIDLPNDIHIRFRTQRADSTKGIYLASVNEGTRGQNYIHLYISTYIYT